MILALYFSFCAVSAFQEMNLHVCACVFCCKVLVFGWLRQRYWGCQSPQLTASLAPRSASRW